MPSFVDTNILVYSENSDAEAKHDAARSLVAGLWESRRGVVSIQVLQELYVVLTRKAPKPLRPKRAREVVEGYMTWTVVENTRPLLRAALDLEQRFRLSFWDALIVQAAIEAGCDRLYSEDLSAGQRIGGLRIINPLA